MITHYLVSFKGHRCALIANRAICSGWLLRCRKGEEPHKFTPEFPPKPSPTWETERRWAVEKTRREIYRVIIETEAARSALKWSIVNGHPLVQRLLADQPDTRKRARRWRIVPVHRGPKGKQP